MRGDATIRALAALVLLTFLVLAVAVYDPLPVDVEFEWALPVVLGCAIGVMVVLYHRGVFDHKDH
ncbi:hypothetical protein [Halocatena halophila]|uniref:hypothetical protein n=1 Tax=Halocatena halophila TaxID=2814576 RepID=UPI002ED24191